MDWASAIPMHNNVPMAASTALPPERSSCLKAHEDMVECRNINNNNNNNNNNKYKPVPIKPCGFCRCKAPQEENKKDAKTTEIIWLPALWKMTKNTQEG